MLYNLDDFVKNGCIDYRHFAETFYYLKTKEGNIVKFIYNDVQNLWNDELINTYGAELQGIRENDLKGRQFGISTVIAGMFSTDFILSSLGLIPMVDSDIYSHKDKETASHFARVNMFVESYMLASQGGDYGDPQHRLEAARLRPHFFKVDTTNLLIAKNGVSIATQTAGAKVSGRGSTRQNVHWSEVGFYPNTPILSAETLVTGAEEQVPEGKGKIFRESTGNLAGDFFANEYFAGKDGRSEFHSRFMGWYLHKPYTRIAPVGWNVPAYYGKLVEDGEATADQCYWHYMKTRELTSKKHLREYPTQDFEAFLMSGTGFFDELAMVYHHNQTKKPIKEAMYVQAL